MIIREGSIEEFKSLWNYSNSPTYNYFVDNITRNNVEFWTIELSKTLIGELYIFWDSIDKDEANGTNRAYLCAFRIKKEYQSLGYGKKLMKAVLNRIKDKGFTEVTIGIDNSSFDKLNSIYTDLGFTTIIKETNIDNHYLDEFKNPVKYEDMYLIKMMRL